jgi:hypothetical protein
MLRPTPPQLLIGIVLIAIAWPMAWFGPAPFSRYTFFPLWLGYILTVDGLTYLRAGSSPLTRNRQRFILLFAFSIPVWWLFEFANQFLENWRYIGTSNYRVVTYVVLASLSFTTVMPAIFVTASLYRTFDFFARDRSWKRLAPSRNGLYAIAGVGLLLFVGSLVFPRILFPFVWIGLFLFIDVINHRTGGKSITEQLAKGHWNTVLMLFAAGITCGFFWEMWNILSMPKWAYDVPHVGFVKIFEMPILGYGGYFPFALEVYAAYHLMHTLLFRQRDTYLCFDEAPVRQH